MTVQSYVGTASSTGTALETVNLAQAASGRLKQGGEILENLMCLSLNTLLHDAGGGTDANLTGSEHKTYDNLCLRVWVNQCGMFSG